MEQRIGPNIQPLQGAAVDPAAVPGITGPRPAEPAATEPGTAGPKATKEEHEPSAAEAPDNGPSGKGSSDEEPEEPEEHGEPEEPEEAQAPEGAPVFEASDRRAKVVADHRGVRLTLDDQEAEFRWDEIGAVETESPRFGKRFTITVHTPDRRWYPLEIEAKSRSDFKSWETELDDVLDAYFEDTEEAPEPSAP
ncbi:hypothetical protein ACIOKD_05500 [Streptomyces sp. NPDC087844]|uniref:hypothetical protein n=1 Tax=Streptomyces sp. NPDC087844 TaxID=3365805 RepID=UPI0037F8F139